MTCSRRWLRTCRPCSDEAGGQALLPTPYPRERTMAAGLQKLGGLLARLSALSLWLAAIGLVAMTIMVAWQVFCRYVLNDSPSWTEPGAVMLMSWFIFLGAAVGVRENYHLGFDVLLYVLPKSGKKWLRLISDLVAFAFRL